MRYAVRFLLVWLFLWAGERLSPDLKAQAIPPPPARWTDRFGIYNWGVDYAAFPGGSTDRLNWAADKVAALGSRTIRLAMPGDIYLLATPHATELAQIAASPAYDRLFSDARFQTYLLTAYSASDMQSQWSDGFSPAEAQATRAEFTRLGEYLLQEPRYAGKTFIILNWEGDNAMEAFANKPSIWEAYTTWIQARADGVKAARQRFPNSSVKLFSGLEFNLVRTKQGVPCGTPSTDRLQSEPLRHRCVLDYVAPRVDVDYYSYSAWQTVLTAAVRHIAFKDALREDLTFALQRLHSRKPTLQAHQLLLGEFGFPRTYWGENAVANFVNEIFDALVAPDAFPVSYAIFWQIIDNAPSYLSSLAGHEDGFGLYRSRHKQFNLTRAGWVVQKRLAGQAVPVLAARPLIRTATSSTRALDEAQIVAALLQGKEHFLLSAPVSLPDYSAALSSSTVTEKNVAIEAQTPAAAFSPSGNTVRLEQGLRQFSLPRDFATAFSESEMRITTGVPTPLHHGTAVLYVTDGEGLESNAKRINLSCQGCPVITNVADDQGVGEITPGGVLTLYGSGVAAAGNTLLIEQLNAQGVPQWFVVPPDELRRETPEHLTARLPRTLLPQKLAVVRVSTSQSLESNDFVVWVTGDGAERAPALRRPQAIFNQAPNRMQLYPGARVTIRGVRFSPRGNQVVLEQGAQRFIVASGPGWSESPTHIQAQLPQELSLGYALFYVVDAQGRESHAQAILLTHAPSQRAVTAR